MQDVQPNVTREIISIVGRGILGVAGIGAGAIPSLVGLEFWLRITSLIVGIAVGVLTFISLWIKLRK